MDCTFMVQFSASVGDDLRRFGPRGGNVLKSVERRTAGLRFAGVATVR